MNGGQVAAESQIVRVNLQFSAKAPISNDFYRHIGRLVTMSASHWPRLVTISASHWPRPNYVKETYPDYYNSMHRICENKARRIALGIHEGLCV